MANDISPAGGADLAPPGTVRVGLQGVLVAPPAP